MRHSRGHSSHSIGPIIAIAYIVAIPLAVGLLWFVRWAIRFTKRRLAQRRRLAVLRTAHADTIEAIGKARQGVELRERHAATREQFLAKYGTDLMEAARCAVIGSKRKQTMEQRKAEFEARYGRVSVAMSNAIAREGK